MRHCTWGVALPAVAAGLLVGAASASADAPPFFAIRNARIVTVAGPAIEAGTIVVERGLITAVGRDVVIPADADIVDGGGLTVYPGLFDAQTDLGLAAAPGGRPTPAQPPSPPRAPARGPAERPGSSPWVEAAHEVSADDRRLERWRLGGFTTALVAPSGGILPGQGAVVNLAGRQPGEMVVKTPASLHVNLQPLRGTFPGSLMGVIAYVKQVFLDAAHYARASTAYEADPRGRPRPAYDRTAAALADAVGAARPTVLPATSRGQIQRALDLASTLGVSPVVVGAHAGYDMALQLKQAGAAVVVNARWPEAPRDGDPDADEPLRVLRLRNRAPSTPARLHEAGVPFAFSSGGLSSPGEFLRNVRRAIDRGLPRDAAVRALTLGPAEIFGVADRLGSIEPGKVANLVVTQGDLFDEATSIRLVVVDGERFTPVSDATDGPATGPSPAGDDRRVEAAASSSAAQLAEVR